MPIEALGYVGIRSRESGRLGGLRDAVSRHAAGREEPQQLSLRMDDRKQRVIVSVGRGRRRGLLRLGSRGRGGAGCARRAGSRRAGVRSRAAAARSPTSGA